MQGIEMQMTTMPTTVMRCREDLCNYEVLNDSDGEVEETSNVKFDSYICFPQRATK
jgi:hypothetical protein